MGLKLDSYFFMPKQLHFKQQNSMCFPLGIFTRFLSFDYCHLSVELR